MSARNPAPPKHELHEKFVTKRWPRRRIAAYYGVGLSVVDSWMRERGVSRDRDPIPANATRSRVVGHEELPFDGEGDAVATVLVAVLECGHRTKVSRVNDPAVYHYKPVKICWTCTGKEGRN